MAATRVRKIVRIGASFIGVERELRRLDEASNPSAGTNRIRFSGLAGFPCLSAGPRNIASGTPLERVHRHRAALRRRRKRLFAAAAAIAAFHFRHAA